MARAARRGTTPHTAMPVLAPKWLVMTPMTGAPMGVPPMNTSMYRPITRPRSPGSAASWTYAFAIDWNARLTRPMAMSSTRNTAMSGAPAPAASKSPNAPAVSASVPSRERAPAPASSAPAADPIASMMLNRPYVLASPWNVDFAIAVSTIGKLRPKVPTIPTRKIVHAMSGRPRRYRAADRNAPRSRSAGGAGMRSEDRSRSRPMVGPI